MKRNHLLFIIIASVTFVSPTPLDNSKQDVTAELSRLAQFGITHRFLDDHTIELYDTMMGWTRLRTLREPSEATIRNWAITRGIPVIDIDPRLVDTSQWTGWYNYWTYVLVSNADKRVPTQAYDFDSNGFPEVYGLDGGIGFPSQHRIYEVYPDGTSLHRYTYPIAGLSTQVLDVDRNGLMDIAFNWGQYTYVYEQPTPTSLPTQLKCAFNKYNPNAAYVSIEHLALIFPPTFGREDKYVSFTVHRKETGQWKKAQNNQGGSFRRNTSSTRFT